MFEIMEFYGKLFFFFNTNKLIDHWAIESFLNEPSLSIEIDGLFELGWWL